MKNLSVVMLIQNFYPSIGGAERQALTLSRKLIAKGVRVSLVTQVGPSPVLHDSMGGIYVRRLGFGAFSFMVLSFAWLVKNVRHYNIIHVHMASSHAVGAALAGKMLGKKVIVKLSGSKEVGEIAVSRRSFIGRLKLRALAFLKPHLVLVSKDQADELNGFGLNDLPAHLIPNGVDTKIFSPATADRKEQLRKSLGWEGLIFLFVGRFSPDKLREDIFTNLLTAWRQVHEDQPSLALYLVGRGELRGVYEEIIFKKGLQNSVHLWDAREDVADLYQAADVFLLPSVTEGLSNALLEAMACGLPMVGSRVPGIVDIIKEGTHGLLFDPLRTEEIKATLESVVRDPVRLREMGRACVENAKSYSIDETVRRTLALYQEAA